ncbi:endo-1,4-beta-xylanase [Salipaludibacillus sp. HK11]|uniref:endo-1,4-beta-xylanase n=1 Tax=Salipaludibacillus sp. HK11 TaxID=3394320 RepID=UPI0039FD063C
MKKKQLKGFIIKLLVLMLVFPAGLLNFSTTAAAEDGETDNVVYHTDFSDDDHNLTVDNGTGERTTVDIDGEDVNAYKVSDRVETYYAADLSFDEAGMENGRTYNISVDLYVDEDEDVPEGSLHLVQDIDSYDELYLNANMVAGETASVSDDFTVDTDVNHAIRIQSNDEGEEVSFYVTGITIEDVTPEDVETPEETEESNEEANEESNEESDEEVNNVVYETDFSNEDHGFETQAGGTGSVENVTIDGDELYAFYITDRTGEWNSPTLPYETANLESGKTYEITANFYTDDSANVAGSYQIADEAYDTFDEAGTIADQEVVTVTAEGTIGDELDKHLRFQTSGEAVELSYYLLDVTIAELTSDDADENGAPDEEVDSEDPAQVMETIDFENGELNGFTGRNGDEELTVVDGENHTEGGNHSLLIENRADTWHGPTLDVVDYVDQGTEYEVSVWVKMDEPSSAELSLSTQIGDGDGASYNNIANATATVTDEDWVELSGTYRYSSMGGGNLSVYVESDDETASFYIDDFSFVNTESAAIEIQHDLDPIKDVYADDFLIGNAITMNELEGVRLELLQKHFNLVTAENAMKPEYLYDDEGNLNFDSQNEFVQTSIDAGFKVHGHAITWHSQSNYDILFPEGISREDAIDSLETYIEAAITNYAQFGDDIVSWDILNEAIVVRGGSYEDWTEHLRDTRALEVIGEDYIQIIFEKAKEVRDDLGLDFTMFYNDYNDHLQDKAQIMYYMVKDINETYQSENNTDELLIEGVGMQSHYNNNLNPANVEQSMDRFISLGVDIGVTELDVMAGDDYVLTEEEEMRQAYIYASVFEIYKERSEHISRVTFWGLDDGQSWRSDQNPLIFDNRLQAKEAYYAVVDPSGFLENYEEEDVPARQSQAVYTDQAPTIDGEIDPVWDDAVVMTGNRAQQAWQTAVANTRSLWDDEFLYLLFEVSPSELDNTNEDPWEQDSVEVFLDQQNTKQTSYATNEGFGQYRVNFDNVFTTGAGGPYDDVESATTVNGTNYIVEMKIPLYAIEPVDGHVLGFDFQVNDAEDGARRGAMAWSDLSGQGFSDPSVFGELILVSEQEEIFEETEVDLGEPVTLNDETKLVIESLQASIRIPADIPPGTEVIVETYTPNEEKDTSGKVLTPAGELITVTMNFPEGEEEYEGEFVLELGINDGAENPGIFYLNDDAWDFVGGDIDGEVIRVLVSGFSTYGVFEVDTLDLIEELEQIINELEERIQELETASEAELEELRSRVSELESQLQFLEDYSIELSEQVAVLQQLIEELETEINNIENGEDSDTTGEGSDTTGEGSDTTGEGSDTTGEGSDTTGEGSDTTGEGSDTTGEGSDTTSASDENGGETLPNTATNNFTMLLIGLLTLLAGAIIFAVVYRRKKLMN